MNEQYMLMKFHKMAIGDDETYIYTTWKGSMADGDRHSHIYIYIGLSWPLTNLHLVSPQGTPPKIHVSPKKI